MIVRVLVLLFAIVMIAAGMERPCADVCCDSSADILDEDVAIRPVETTPLPSVPTSARTVARAQHMAPASVTTRVFRPPRAILA